MINISISKMLKLDYRTSEAYKTLRTNIEFCGQDIKVIALTSCTPSEGKSSVSVQLAASLAEAGKKVMFIDADLRKSVLLGRFRIHQNVKGLVHLLSEQAQLADVICMTDVPNLHMIFAGPVPPNPAELLGGRYFKKLLASLREVYDYIIVDTPPLGSVIDSAVIAKECDGAALIISFNTVSYKFAQDVKTQLEKAGCKILGVILNKVDMSGNSYYGKYYGKYYGQYYGKDKE